MKKVDNYKKILEILWNKYFKATFNFTKSKINLTGKSDNFLFANKHIRTKYNPDGY